MLLQHGHCTFVTIRFRPFATLFINLAMLTKSLFTKPTTTLGLVEQASILEGATFHKMSYCKFLWGNPCKAIETFYHWGAFSWDFGFSMLFLSFCCMIEFGDGFDGVIFPRLLTSWRKLQLSPFTHCELVSHCQQSPRILCPRCFVPMILDHGVLLKISISGSKILISNILFDTSFHHRLQSVRIRSCFLLMNLQVI